MFCFHPRYHADSDKTSGSPTTQGLLYLALRAAARSRSVYSFSAELRCTQGTIISCLTLEVWM